MPPLVLVAPPGHRPGSPRPAAPATADRGPARVGRASACEHGARPAAPAATLLAIVGVLAAVSPAAAVPVDHLWEEWGVGARDLAMGNTGVATARDLSALYLNPAALSRVPGTRFTMGVHLHEPDLQIDLADGRSLELGADETLAVLTGFTTDLAVLPLVRTGILGRFTFGLALSASYPIKSFTTYADPDEPQFYRYNDRQNSILPFGFGFGFRLTDWASLGLSILLSPTDTKIAVDTLAVSDVLPADQPGQLFTVEFIPGVAADAFPTIAPVVGLLVRPPVAGLEELVELGVVYRDEISTIDGTGPVTFTVQLGVGDTVIELPDPFLTQLALLTGWSPRQVGIGLGLTPATGLTVAIDTTWKQWSEWETSLSIPPVERFDDTWQVRAGVEWVLDLDHASVPWVALRAGYYFEPSPVPDQSGPANVLDSDKHVVAAGLATAWVDPLDMIEGVVSWHLGVQAHLLEDRRTGNEGDPDFGPFEAGGELLGGTFAMEVAF